MSRGNLRRLLRAHFSHPRSVVIALIFAFVVISVTAIVPLLIARVIDQTIREGRTELLAPLVGGILGLSAVKAVAIAMRKRHAGLSSIGTEARLRAQLYEHLQGLDIAYHENVSTGQLMSRASSDLQAARDFLSIIPIGTSMAALIVVITIILFTVDVPLAAVTLAGFPFMGLAAARLTRRLHPLIYGQQQQLAELTQVAEETITGIRVVKAFGREEHQVGRLRQKAEGVLEMATKVIGLRAILQPLFELFPALSLAFVLWFGGFRVVNGHISFGLFIAFFVYVTQLQWPVRMMGWIASDGQKAATSSGRIFEVLDIRPGIEDKSGAQPIEIQSGDIRFEEVAFETGESRRILDAVDLTVPAGGSLALVGPTGCGKTTMLRMVLRFLEPTSGRIAIDDNDISEVTLESLRNQIGTVFEETFLFSDTIRNNIAFGRPDATDDEIVTAAVLAHAHGFISDLPDAYETVVGEQGFTLSGGQRQRVSIARAILMDPRLLLLDDATSAVDPTVEAEIRLGLAEAMKGRTTLIVARRPGSAALADEVAFMENGSITDRGTHDELWARSARYRETLIGGELARRIAAEGVRA